jgi:uncharacterized protein YjbI with pentapeptide repeats
MITPRRAPVHPRILSPYSGESLLLEDEVRALVNNATSGSIFITGSAGSGKTTALEHLAFVLAGADSVRFLDQPDYGEVLRAQQKEWVICTSIEKVPNWLRLAPWGMDERIEYLLAAHKEQCASVMARLGGPAGPDPLDGNPELWRIVLDQMAADDTLPSARQALDRFLHALLAASPAGRKYQIWALANLLHTPYLAEIELELRTAEGDSRFRVLRHHPVQLILGAAQIIQDIQTSQPCEYFGRCFPRDLVRETALAARGQPASLELLQTWFAERPERHAMAASILHAADIGWVPQSGTRPKLGGAYLEGIALPGTNLSGVDFSAADLSHADLRGADLESVRAIKADLRYACLHGASLEKFVANEANMEGADLASAKLRNAFLDGASLENADLSDADLQKASLASSNLRGANLSRANLRHATLTEANLEGAVFVEADLEGAILVSTKLREADFTGARFYGARMNGCDLEDMELPGADFRKASLQDALLTGSIMPDARFDDACFHGAGLADIDWERASLRGADLRGVSFHLGSSRSGRVGSPIACAGSRTGFYTDDYNEQDFKAPEEIRKANLCFADLRGARIDDVDFYLVDLRHALFDPEHEAHLRRCGAILEARK